MSAIFIYEINILFFLFLHEIYFRPILVLIVFITHTRARSEGKCYGEIGKCIS